MGNRNTNGRKEKWNALFELLIAYITGGKPPGSPYVPHQLNLQAAIALGAQSHVGMESFVSSSQCWAEDANCPTHQMTVLKRGQVKLFSDDLHGSPEERCVCMPV